MTTGDDASPMSLPEDEPRGLLGGLTAPPDPAGAPGAEVTASLGAILLAGAAVYTAATTSIARNRGLAATRTRPPTRLTAYQMSSSLIM